MKIITFDQIDWSHKRACHINHASEPFTYCGRMKHLNPIGIGNPFSASRDGSREEACRKFMVALNTSTFLQKIALSIPDNHSLACHCVPQKCHVHVIATWLDVNKS